MRYSKHGHRSLEIHSTALIAKGCSAFSREETAGDAEANLMQFAGCLGDCPALRGDPVVMQRGWRDEWE